jgi:hypothetical protein
MRNHHSNSRWHALNYARRPIALPHNEIYYGTYRRIWRRKPLRVARRRACVWAMWRFRQRYLTQMGTYLNLTVCPQLRKWWLS